MRLVKKRLEKDGEGTVDLIPQEDEDMWHVYNLLCKGDSITASTFRSVSKVTDTGSSHRSRLAITVTISVDKVDFDAQACHIRVKGRNVKENEYMKMGQHHTIDLELNKKFSLSKPAWDSIFLERVDEACDPRNLADVAAITMEQGLANLSLIMTSMTIVRAKVEVNIPRKRAGFNSSYDKAISRFHDGIIEAIDRHVNFQVVKCVIIASPGYLAEDFYKYLFEQAVKRDLKKILENKSKFMIAHSSAGTKQALKEVLADPAVVSKISDTKAFGEVKAMQRFYEVFNENPDRAFYGYKHVLHANEEKAIETLLLTDSLFRNADVPTRRKYVELVEKAKENGADVKVFSSMHVTGEQLAKMSGVAAILRFPIVLEDDAFEEEEVTEEAEKDPAETKVDFDDDDDGDDDFYEEDVKKVTTGVQRMTSDDRTPEALDLSPVPHARATSVPVSSPATSDPSSPNPASASVTPLRELKPLAKKAETFSLGKK